MRVKASDLAKDLNILAGVTRRDIPQEQKYIYPVDKGMMGVATKEFGVVYRSPIASLLKHPVKAIDFYNVVSSAKGDLDLSSVGEGILVESTHGNFTVLYQEGLKSQPKSLPRFHRKSLDVEIHKEEFYFAAAAVSKRDQGRPALNSICLNFRTREMAGTDGRALNVSKFRAEKPGKDILIPAYAIPLMKAVLRRNPGTFFSKLGYKVLEGGVPESYSFRAGNFIVFLTYPVPYGDYPDYRAVIPRGSRYVMTLNRRDLSDALKELHAFLKNDSGPGTTKLGPGVKMAISSTGELVMRTFGAVGKREIGLPIGHFEGCKEAIRGLAVNPGLLLMGLWDPEVTVIQGNDISSPLVIDGCSVVAPINSSNAKDRRRHTVPANSIPITRVYVAGKPRPEKIKAPALRKVAPLEVERKDPIKPLPEPEIRRPVPDLPPKATSDPYRPKRAPTTKKQAVQQDEGSDIKKKIKETKFSVPGMF